jgi:crotonobetainyl-CoA:carnitine CoA-transferase CaiB-like acyl-CoA transferase
VTEPAAGPLNGVRVVDLTTSYAGPTATTYLADMGADVVKIERPKWGDDTRYWGPPFRDGESAWFHAGNRNKRSVSLDLRLAGDQERLDQLLATADVLIESFNPSKLAALDLDPKTTRERHPRLIYCALSGYGLDGPDANRAGYDLTAQARSGMMSITGARGGPPQRVSTALCDVMAGTIAAFAISAALVRQQATGAGELIDVALLEAGLSVTAPRVASYLAGEPEPKPSGATDSVLAVYQRFEAADRSIVLAVGNDDMWRRVCDALELPELANESTATNADRRAVRTELTDAIQRQVASRPAVAWLQRLHDRNVPASLVQGLSEVVTDPQIEARNCIGTLTNGFAYVRSPWRLASADPDRIATAVGPVGGDTDDVFRDWLAPRPGRAAPH